MRAIVFLKLILKYVARGRRPAAAPLAHHYYSEFAFTDEYGLCFVLFCVSLNAKKYIHSFPLS